MVLWSLVSNQIMNLFYEFQVWSSGSVCNWFFFFFFFWGGGGGGLISVTVDNQISTISTFCLDSLGCFLREVHKDRSETITYDYSFIVYSSSINTSHNPTHSHEWESQLNSPLLHTVSCSSISHQLKDWGSCHCTQTHITCYQ